MAAGRACHFQEVPIMPRIVPCILVALLLAGCNGSAPSAEEAGKHAIPATASRREAFLGEKLFDHYCKICHGRGPHSLGAPSLEHRKFRYGRTAATIKTTIRAGRPKGMPAFNDDFNNIQLNALATYVLSLAP
jgi:mono/diheme cytochrome c family protein